MISNQTTYSRLELAQEQLEVALSLFLENMSYASAITLAGAAEEIFGKELINLGKQNVLDWKHNIMEDCPMPPSYKKPTKKEFNDTENFIRNALKHHNHDKIMITADLQKEACDMLVRACANAHELDLKIALFEEFDEWFHIYNFGEQL